MENEYVCRCRFEAVEEDEAVCLVQTPDGYECPRVGFSTDLISQHQLKPGDWFFWRSFIGTDQWVIEPNPCADPSFQTPEEKAEMNRLIDNLHTESQKHREPWPEYTGDGE